MRLTFLESCLDHFGYGPVIGAMVAIAVVSYAIAHKLTPERK